MINMIPVVGLMIGIIFGISANFYIPPEYSRYVAIAILASLDTVFGAVVAGLQKSFNIKIFLSGFFGNALLAAGLTMLGQQLGVDLGLAAIVVFGARIFNNFAVLRRILIDSRLKK